MFKFVGQNFFYLNFNRSMPLSENAHNLAHTKKQELSNRCDNTTVEAATGSILLLQKGKRHVLTECYGWIPGLICVPILAKKKKKKEEKEEETSDCYKKNENSCMSTLALLFGLCLFLLCSINACAGFTWHDSQQVQGLHLSWNDNTFLSSSILLFVHLHS